MKKTKRNTVVKDSMNVMLAISLVGSRDLTWPVYSQNHRGSNLPSVAKGDQHAAALPTVVGTRASQ
jgi:hypothetical protein